MTKILKSMVSTNIESFKGELNYKEKEREKMKTQETNKVSKVQQRKKNRICTGNNKQKIPHENVFLVYGLKTVPKELEIVQ